MTRKKTQQTSSSIDGTTAYARDVVSGKVVAGPYVRAACKRHLDDLKNAGKRGLYFDVAAAERFFDFCHTVLRLSEAQFEGIPFDLHPSQKFICGSLFGWKRKTDDMRRFRRAYIEQGKGNGKSPMVGAIGLYGLVSDGEAGAQIFSAGATKEQSGILFSDAVKMVEKSPKLSEVLKPSGGPGREFNLLYRRTNSFFRPVSKETKKTGSGWRPHFALCDEIHEHPDGGMIEILERGFKFRQQPLLVMITNSGSDRSSICWKEREHAIDVVNGLTEDDKQFSYICALDEGDDPLEDPSCWIKANPLLGVTINEEFLETQAKQAKDIPGKANGIKRLHFCQWTDAEKAWIGIETWTDIEDATLDISQFQGRECYVGLDLSAKSDLTAKALVFPDGVNAEGERRFAAFVHAYTPRDTMHVRAKEDSSPYHLWEERGWLTSTPGKKIQMSFLARDLMADDERFDLRRVAYDQYLIDDLEDHLDQIGCALPLYDHPQNWTKKKHTDETGQDFELYMPGSIDRLETLIFERRLRVHVNHGLRTAVSSATFVATQSGARRLTKQKAVRRIDMLIALAMGIGAATAIEGDTFESVYERRGMVMF